MTPRARAAAALLGLLSALAVCTLQPSLAAEARAARAAQAPDTGELRDVVLLPRPAELKLLGLQQIALLVDWLWGKTLVEYGVHVHEKRAFEVERYLDTILALEPDYFPLYQYVDTLLVYRPPRGSEQDALRARAYLEAGLRVRPFDHRIWKQYGQFVAYLAPSFLSDPAERERWRRDGARALMRAVELGADEDASLAASALLARHGERDAALQHLQKLHTITSDPEQKKAIEQQLEQLQILKIKEQLKDADQYIEQRRLREAPALPRSVYSWLGPMPDPIECLQDTHSAHCAGSLHEALRRRSRDP